MRSRKGLVLTGIILAGITAASFVIWLVPEGGGRGIITISDEGARLDAAANIHGVISSAATEEFESLLKGDRTPAEYREGAEVSLSQVNFQIAGLVGGGVSETWLESYQAYIESMQGFGAYLRETLVVADMIEDGMPAADIESAVMDARALLAESERLASESYAARP